MDIEFNWMAFLGAFTGGIIGIPVMVFFLWRKEIMELWRLKKGGE